MLGLSRLSRRGRKSLVEDRDADEVGAKQTDKDPGKEQIGRPTSSQVVDAIDRSKAQLMSRFNAWKVESSAMYHKTLSQQVALPSSYQCDKALDELSKDPLEGEGSVDSLADGRNYLRHLLSSSSSWKTELLTRMKLIYPALNYLIRECESITTYRRYQDFCQSCSRLLPKHSLCSSLALVFLQNRQLHDFVNTAVREAANTFREQYEEMLANDLKATLVDEDLQPSFDLVVEWYKRYFSAEHLFQPDPNPSLSESEVQKCASTTQYSRDDNLLEPQEEHDFKIRSQKSQSSQSSSLPIHDSHFNTSPTPSKFMSTHSSAYMLYSNIYPALALFHLMIKIFAESSVDFAIQMATSRSFTTALANFIIEGLVYFATCHFYSVWRRSQYHLEQLKLNRLSRKQSRDGSSTHLVSHCHSAKSESGNVSDPQLGVVTVSNAVSAASESAPIPVGSHRDSPPCDDCQQTHFSPCSPPLDDGQREVLAANKAAKITGVKASTQSPITNLPPDSTEPLQSAFEVLGSPCDLSPEVGFKQRSSSLFEVNVNREAVELNPQPSPAEPLLDSPEKGKENHADRANSRYLAATMNVFPAKISSTSESLSENPASHSHKGIPEMRISEEDPIELKPTAFPLSPTCEEGLPPDGTCEQQDADRQPCSEANAAHGEPQTGYLEGKPQNPLNASQLEAHVSNGVSESLDLNNSLPVAVDRETQHVLSSSPQAFGPVTPAESFAALTPAESPSPTLERPLYPNPEVHQTLGDVSNLGSKLETSFQRVQHGAESESIELQSALCPDIANEQNQPVVSIMDFRGLETSPLLSLHTDTSSAKVLVSTKSQQTLPKSVNISHQPDESLTLNIVRTGSQSHLNAYGCDASAPRSKTEQKRDADDLHLTASSISDQLTEFPRLSSSNQRSVLNESLTFSECQDEHLSKLFYHTCIRLMSYFIFGTIYVDLSEVANIRLKLTWIFNYFTSVLTSDWSNPLFDLAEHFFEAIAHCHFMYEVIISAVDVCSSFLRLFARTSEILMQSKTSETMISSTPFATKSRLKKRRSIPHFHMAKSKGTSALSEENANLSRKSHSRAIDLANDAGRSRSWSRVEKSSQFRVAPLLNGDANSNIRRESRDFLEESSKRASVSGMFGSFFKRLKQKFTSHGSLEPELSTGQLHDASRSTKCETMSSCRDHGHGPYTLNSAAHMAKIKHLQNLALRLLPRLAASCQYHDLHIHEKLCEVPERRMKSGLATSLGSQQSQPSPYRCLADITFPEGSDLFGHHEALRYESKANMPFHPLQHPGQPPRVENNLDVSPVVTWQSQTLEERQLPRTKHVGHEATPGAPHSSSRLRNRDNEGSFQVPFPQQLGIPHHHLQRLQNRSPRESRTVAACKAITMMALRECESSVRLIFDFFFTELKFQRQEPETYHDIILCLERLDIFGERILPNFKSALVASQFTNLYRCAQCGRQCLYEVLAARANQNTYTCSHCRLVRYCSRSCRRKMEPLHICICANSQ